MTGRASNEAAVAVSPEGSGWLLFCCTWMALLAPLASICLWKSSWLQSQPAVTQFPLLKSCVVLSISVGAVAFALGVGIIMLGAQKPTAESTRNLNPGIDPL